MMVLVLLFILSTFLTFIGLFNFYSLNPYFVAIFLFINTSVMPLSKSTFTITLSCMFTFSTPIFSYTSLNILNILLIFLCLFFFFAVLLETSIHILFCCTFPFIEHTTTPQFYYSFFFSILYFEYKIFLLSCFNTFLPIISFLLHSTYCTLVISFLFTSPFFQFYAFWYRLYYIFLICLLRRKSYSQFL